MASRHFHAGNLRNTQPAAQRRQGQLRLDFEPGRGQIQERKIPAMKRAVAVAEIGELHVIESIYQRHQGAVPETPQPRNVAGSSARYEARAFDKIVTVRKKVQEVWYLLRRHTAVR